MSREITRIFKEESSATYYLPYKKVGDQEIPISGKLWDNFNYEKKLLRAIGLVRLKTVSTVPLHITTSKGKIKFILIQFLIQVC